MSAVICPFCTRPTTLPDPWPHAGYVCPHCHATVGLAAVSPPPPPPPADPFDLGDDTPSRPSRVHYRNRTTAGDSFAQGFGHAMGQHVAGCLASLAVLGVFAAAAVWWFYLR